jgi:hypothetical protein
MLGLAERYLRNERRLEAERLGQEFNEPPPIDD